MATIYLMSRYSRYVELQGYAGDLRVLGHEVISRWIQGDHQITDTALIDEHGTEGYATSERQRFADEDWEDLMRADWVIAFTEAPRSGFSRGGRHIEFGAAMAMGKRLIVIQWRENVFYCRADVEFHATWPDCLAALATEAGGVDLDPMRRDEFGGNDAI